MEFHEPVKIATTVAAWSVVGVGSMSLGSLVAFSLPGSQGLGAFFLGVAGGIAAWAKGIYLWAKKVDRTADKLEAHMSLCDALFRAVHDNRTDDNRRLIRTENMVDSIDGKVDEILDGMRSIKDDRSTRNARDNAFQNDVRGSLASPIYTPDPDAPPVHKPEQTP